MWHLHERSFVCFIGRSIVGNLKIYRKKLIDILNVLIVQIKTKLFSHFSLWSINQNVVYSTLRVIITAGEISVPDDIIRSVCTRNWPKILRWSLIKIATDRIYIFIPIISNKKYSKKKIKKIFYNSLLKSQKGNSGILKDRTFCVGKHNEHCLN